MWFCRFFLIIFFLRGASTPIFCLKKTQKDIRSIARPCVVAIIRLYSLYKSAFSVFRYALRNIPNSEKKTPELVAAMAKFAEGLKGND